jgi:RNA polymerase sigma-70 factor (ECF subfamily)
LGGLEEIPTERQLFDLVYRQMRSLTAGRDAELDDLVQDAMEQAWTSLGRFEGRAKLSTWTFQICYRTLLKRRRWYGRWLKRFTLTTTGELPDAPQSGLGAHTQVEASERAQRLRQALSHLAPKKRAVVVLHDLEGLRSEEIVDVVGTKLGTVRSRLRDGRRELLELLREDPLFSSQGECDVAG